MTFWNLDIIKGIFDLIFTVDTKMNRLFENYYCAKAFRHILCYILMSFWNLSIIMGIFVLFFSTNTIRYLLYKKSFMSFWNIDTIKGNFDLFLLNWHQNKQTLWKFLLWKRIPAHSLLNFMSFEISTYYGYLWLFFFNWHHKKPTLWKIIWRKPHSGTQLVTFLWVFEIWT